MNKMELKFQTFIGKRDSMMVVCCPRSLVSPFPNLNYSKTAFLTDDSLQLSFGAQFDDVLLWTLNAKLQRFETTT